MRVIVVILALSLSVPSFAADSPDRPHAALSADTSAPWARGVPLPTRRQATEHFDTAVRLVRDSRYAQSVDVFRKALALWDHPAIHLELAKALLNLGESSDALAHLWAATRYGASPIAPDSVNEVTRDARRVLDTQVAHLVIRSDEVGLTVKLGTNVVLSGPGTWEGVVSPGVREISAQRPGQKPMSILARSLNAGMRSELTIRAGSPLPGKIDSSFAERRATDDDVRALQRQLLGFEVPVFAPDTVSKSPDGADFPRRLGQICANAKGDTAVVCAEYVTLHDQVERDRAAARKRLDEQTRGGVVDTLR